MEAAEMSAAERLEHYHRRSDRQTRERNAAFPSHLKALISKAEMDLLQQLFNTSDADNSGLIGIEELPKML